MDFLRETSFRRGTTLLDGWDINVPLPRVTFPIPFTFLGEKCRQLVISYVTWNVVSWTKRFLFTVQIKYKNFMSLTYFSNLKWMSSVVWRVLFAKPRESCGLKFAVLKLQNKSIKIWKEAKLWKFFKVLFTKLPWFLCDCFLILFRNVVEPDPLDWIDGELNKVLLMYAVWWDLLSRSS